MVTRATDRVDPTADIAMSSERTPVVKSLNFEFLRERRPYLADLGGFAEQYVHRDPAGALIKLRTMAEAMVNDLYAALGLRQPFDSDFFTLLDGQPFRDSVPPVVLTKFHAVRKLGNKAAHGGSTNIDMASHALREAHQLASWLHLAVDKGTRGDCPEYSIPPDGGVGEEKKADLKRERKAALEKLAAQEVRMQRLLDELAAVRARADEAEKSAQELELIVQAGHEAAGQLSFDEADTRKFLVDTMLVAAGWDVGAATKSTEQVGQEVDVDHQPTPTGKGRADYVLWDEAGQPVGVVEVKKTFIEAAQGRHQAKLYADGLEKMYGTRPVIFYTNGFELYIWDDAQNEVDRKLYGFYSKDSLAYLHFQRVNRLPLSEVALNLDIAGGDGRLYQVEAIKQVGERFEEGRRTALIVQATGSGKTRTAVALCDVLLRANRAKRILFLCDRRELRKQAMNAFKQHLPSAKRVAVTAKTAEEREHQVYLATYPAMRKCFESFDVGFFDLVIADESHRSIYNRYKDLFDYFDALQIGLTATPVRFIDRNTYALFGCEDQDPTAHFPLDRAISEGVLLPFRVRNVQTKFQRQGMKWAEMSDSQRAQLEQQMTDAANFDYDATDLDRYVFNKDTNRMMLQNLMENGIRDSTGQVPGKTIVFARGHRHALLLKQLFDDLYPQYGGNFCAVIDNYDPRAEQLIDDFKGQGQHNNIQIAVSVDMMDTGIDVPEIVNLVFAKPVKSYVKFWQMIGRGTRQCKNLFGPGVHKSEFLIFDHWGNFEFFGESYVEPTPSLRKSLLHQLFETRIDLAETALRKPELESFAVVVDLVRQDITSLEATHTIAVRDTWRTIKKVSDPQLLTQFDSATKGALLQDVAPLMKERDIRGLVEAHEFDLLIARLQRAHLTGASEFQDLKGELLNCVARLKMNLAEVKAKAETVARVKGPEFWDAVDFGVLEDVRIELRAIMKFREQLATPANYAKVVDVAEEASLVREADYPYLLEGHDAQALYRKRVEQILRDLLDSNATLQKIKAGVPVDQQDLDDLVSLVLAQNPDVDLVVLQQLYPKTVGHLDLAIRRVIGLDARAVEKRFEVFVQQHPELNARQVRFLSLLKSLIATAGAIELERLYEPPFTTLDADGIDGLFDDKTQIDELLGLIASFQTPDPLSANSAPGSKDL
jgi:type I restriction enzyme R subunit